MIILDTHIWVWYVQGDERFREEQRELVLSQESNEIGICSISFWEVAKAVELHRLYFSMPIYVWLETELNYPGISLLPLTARIAVESTQLPGIFHKDPFDQLMVATARIYDVLLVTADAPILNYRQIKLLPQ